ncbi:unknown [Salmonella phage FelixO1]|uniref:Uncharacterized protein n=1 Tax=Salmonella phage Felix O1 (isolate Felix O1-VT1) TaxID=1283336 RepID=Q6KGE4_BPFO1|nr:unknown [Salmonella phage FelixO1]
MDYVGYTSLRDTANFSNLFLRKTSGFNLSLKTMCNEVSHFVYIHWTNITLHFSLSISLPIILWGIRVKNIIHLSSSVCVKCQSMNLCL